MIDPALPMELDDGTPVALRGRPTSQSITVICPKSPLRPGQTGAYAYAGPWCFNRKTGVIGGSTAAKYYTLRNTATAFEPEEYEGWFV